MGTLLKQLEQEQGNMSQYTERQAKASAAKADLEVQIQAAGEALIKKEQQRQMATQDKRDFEQGKTNRDHTMRSLNDEITNQDEVVNKLNKEKKQASENNGKANEDLVAAQEKVDHLNKIKMKLESTLDELNDSLAREKRAKGDIEKQRRKVEGDLRVSQEVVSDLERTK